MTMRDSTIPDNGCGRRACGSYRAGHDVHFIHAKRVGQTPWGWRDAVVAELTGGADGLSVALDYVHEEGAPTVWHHRPLGDVLRVGEPIRLHEQYYVLGSPKGWFSVVIAGGLGGIAEPADKTGWAATVGAVDLRSGGALPTDHRIGLGELD